MTREMQAFTSLHGLRRPRRSTTGCSLLGRLAQPAPSAYLLVMARSVAPFASMQGPCWAPTCQEEETAGIV